MGILSFFGLGDKVAKVVDSVGDNTVNLVSAFKGDIPPKLKAQLQQLEVKINGDLENNRMKLKGQLAELMTESQKQVYDFALKYEGTAEQVPRWVMIMRSMIRPVITIFYFIWLMVFMTVDLIKIIELSKLGTALTADALVLTMLPTAFWAVLGIILGFWFGGRAGEGLVAQLNKKKKR